MRLPRLTALAGIAWCVSCGGGTEPAAVPKPAVEEPSVRVVQALAAHPYRFGWLDETRVLMLDDARFVVWEPATDRVLVHEALDELANVEARAGLPAGTLRFPAALAQEADVIDTPSGTRVLHDPWSRERRLVVTRSGEEVGAVPADEDDVIALATDMSRAAICGRRGIRIVDLDDASVVVSSDEEAHGCIWEGGPLAVARENDVVLLDASSLEPLATPFSEAILGAPSLDGAQIAVVLSGGREGVSVIDVASRTELFHRGMVAPTSIRLLDGLLFAGNEHGGEIIDVETGRTLVPSSSEARPGHLGRHGRALALDGDVVVVRHRDGTSTRSGLPVRASTTIEDALGVVARVRERAFWLDEALVSHEMGRCLTASPGELGGGRGGSFRLQRAGHRIHGLGGACVTHDDGTAVTGTFVPVAVGEDGTFLAQAEGRLEIRAPDGAVRAVVALDPGEDPPCHAAYCPIPFAIAPDARYVVMARGPRLRVFDGATGAKLAEREVLPRTDRIEITAGDLLLHEDHDTSGVGMRRTRSVLSLPTLEPRGTWRAELVMDDVHVGARWGRIEDDIVETRTDALIIRGLDGRIVRSIERPASAMVPMRGAVLIEASGEVPVVILAWPSLDPIGTIPGWVMAVGETEVLSCMGSHVHHTTLTEGALESADLGVECVGAGPLTVRSRSAFVLAADHETALFRSDGAMASLVLTMDASGVAVSGIAGEELLGPVLVALRAPSLTSAGMRLLPPATRSLAAWWGEPR